MPLYHPRQHLPREVTLTNKYEYLLPAGRYIVEKNRTKNKIPDQMLVCIRAQELKHYGLHEEYDHRGRLMSSKRAVTHAWYDLQMKQDDQLDKLLDRSASWLRSISMNVSQRMERSKSFPETFKLTAEVGLLESFEVEGLVDECHAFIKTTASWMLSDSYPDKGTLLALLQIGWDFDGEAGALLCIQKRWPEYVESIKKSGHFFLDLTKETTSRPCTGERLETTDYNPGECPCGNPMCTGSHSFFHNG